MGIVTEIGVLREYGEQGSSETGIAPALKELPEHN